MPHYRRKKPVISFPKFLDKASRVRQFTSSRGKRYLVLDMQDLRLYFLRLDAKRGVHWDIDLEQLYKAYTELDDFHTAAFKKYVPLKHSPGRGLLLHLGLIRPL